VFDFFKILFWFLAAGAVAIAILATILSNPESALSAALLIGVFILIYLLPSLVAAHRKHNNHGAIVALNVLLGWTLLGWVAALVWALTDNTRA